MSFILKLKEHIKLRKKVMLSRSKGGNFIIAVFLLAFCAFMALPMLYVILQAFKPIDEIFIYPPRFFVKNPTLDNFRQVMQLAQNLWVPFSRYLFNSLFVTVVGTVAYIFVASLAGYSLGKGKFYGKEIVSVLIVWALLFRPEVMSIPTYIVINKLNMINTYWSLILPSLASSMGVFLIRQFVVVSIPDSTLEAARIDGANEFIIFTKIGFPCIKPAILTVTIFTFQALWGGGGAEQYIYSESLKQLPTVLSTIAAGGIARAGAASSVSVLLLIPPVIIFLISQSSVMETMSHSGLK